MYKQRKSWIYFEITKRKNSGGKEMLIPKSKIETVELMNKEYYLGDLSYDLDSEEYSFKRNEDIKDLELYPAVLWIIW